MVWRQAAAQSGGRIMFCHNARERKDQTVMRDPSTPSSSKESGSASQQTAFGFRQVALDDKQHLVDDVFHGVARRYDLMNDLMSGGLHRVWKDAMVSWLAPPRRGDFAVIDVAGGTGDIATRIKRRSGGKAHVTVADINGSMLAVGRERAEKAGMTGIEFVEANAEKLPFADASFDAYSQCAAHREGAGRGVPGPETWRPVPLPGIFASRRADARQGL
jgi:demethylmenaquinone methyltransferase/2-methoxy-6-polyprenyl-1,4-benzoquinol methylase